MLMSLRDRLNKTFQRDLFRNRHLVALGLALTDSEYRLHDLLSALCNWTETEHNYVTITQSQLAGFISWDKSSVSRVLKKLKSRGLVEEKGRSLYLIHPLSEFIGAIPKQEAIVAGLKPNVAMEQRNYSQINSSSNTSNKENIFTTIKTNEEYQKIIDEGGYTSMDVSDLRWIDENLAYEA